MHKGYGFVLFLAVCGGQGLFANPSNPHVLIGEGSFQTEGSHFTVQAADKTIIQWDAFSIEPSEVASFQLPSVNSSVLNRVSSSDVSRLFGELHCNGNLYLINPNGIIIGKEGIIQVGGFIGSTLDLSDGDFLAGKDLRFFDRDSKGIVHEGIIKASGDIALLATEIINRGGLEAPGGLIAMGAGREIVFLPHGDQRIQILLQPEEKDLEKVGIQQSGTLLSLAAELKADGNLYGYAIKNEGLIEATRIQQDKGRIYLVAEEGVVYHSGSLKADEVRILGQHTRLMENAVIDASGKEGGGHILIGGDFQGSNPEILNANSTLVEKGVFITAAALEKGDGGRVIIWADDATKCDGTVKVHAGPLGGDGGFAEISGKAYLDFTGRVDATAPLGKTGTLLLDPSNLTISGAANSNVTFTACPTGTYATTANPANILNTDIVTNLGTCSISISTAGGAGGTGTIDVNSPISWATNNSLTMTSNSTFTISANITNTSNSASLTLTNLGTTANTAINIASGVTVSLTGTSGASTGTLTLTSSAVATLDLTISGTLSATDKNLTISVADDITLNSTGSINFNSPGKTFNLTTTAVASNVTLNGPVSINGTGVWSLAGTATAAPMGLTISSTGSLTTSGTENCTITSNGTIVTASGSTVTHGSSGTLTMTVQTTAAADLEFDGIVSVPIGGGNLTLSAIDDFVLGPAPAKIDFLAPTKTFSLTTTAAGSNVVLNGAVTLAGTSTFTLAGTSVVVATPGMLINSTFTTSGTGNCTITSNGSIVSTSASTITHGSTGTLSMTAQVTATADIEFDGVVSVPVEGGNLTLNVIDDFILGAAPAKIDFLAPTKAFSLTTTSTGSVATLGGAVTLAGATNTFTLAGTAAGTMAINSSFTTSGSGSCTIISDGTITLAAGQTLTHGSTGDFSATVQTTAAADMVINGIFTVPVSAGNVTLNVIDDFTLAAAPAKIEFFPTGKTLLIVGTSSGSVANFMGPVTSHGITNLTTAGTAVGAITLSDGFITSGSNPLTITSAGGISVGAAGNLAHGSTGNLSMTTSGGGDIVINGIVSVTSANATFAPDDDFTLGAATGSIVYSAAGKTLSFFTGPTTTFTFNGNVNVTGGNVVVTAINDIVIGAAGSWTYNVPGGTCSMTSTGIGVDDPDITISGTLTVTNGTLTVTAFDDITVGGTLNYHSPATSILAATGTDGDLSITGIFNMTNGSLTLIAIDDLTFGGTSTATISPSGFLTLQTTSVTAGDIAFSGNATMTSGALTMDAMGSVTFGGAATSFIYSSPLPWTTTAHLGGITFTKLVNITTNAPFALSAPLGSIIIDNLVRNTDGGNMVASCGVDFIIGDIEATIPSQFGTAGGMTHVAAGGDLVIISSQDVAGASATLGFVSPGKHGNMLVDIGGSAMVTAKADSDAVIATGGTLTMSVGEDLFLIVDQATAPLGRAYISSDGQLSVTATNMTYLGFVGGPQVTVSTTQGDIELIATNKINLGDGSFIRNLGPGDVTLVVDQQASFPPQIGTGGLTVNSSAGITTAGSQILFFTALPSQNSLMGTVNGLFFNQGNIVFGVYFSTFTGVGQPPFTVFYKAGSSTLNHQFAIDLSELTQEYLDRMMGWSWAKPFFACYDLPDSLSLPSDEYMLYLRRGFEYPLNLPVEECSAYD